MYPKIKNFNVKELSLLITRNTRLLDLTLIKEIKHDDICHLLHLASTKCPVKTIYFIYSCIYYQNIFIFFFLRSFKL